MGVKLGLSATGVRETVPGKTVQLILQIAIITSSYRTYLKLFEGRNLEEEYPAENRSRKILAGLAIGAGLIVMQVVILAVLGHYSIVSYQPSERVVKYLALISLSGFEGLGTCMAH